MIKNDFEKGLHISGHPVEIAAEFEEIARTVRVQFCCALGEQVGMDLFEECIKNSKMDEGERAEYAEREIENARIQHPEAAKAADIFVEALAKRIFGGGH